MDTASKFDLYESAISCLYEAPTDPRAWAEFMAKFGGLIDARGGQYLLWDPAQKQIGFSVMTDEYPEKDAEYYNTHVAPVDERRQLVEQALPGRWMFDHEHFDARFVDRSEAYRWLHSCNIRYSAAVRLAEGNNMLSLIALFRAPRQQPFSHEERYWLDRVTPHIQRASKLHLRLDSLRTSAAAGWQAMSTLDYPILVVDEQARIQFTNLAADAMLRAPRAPMQVRQGQLRGATPASHERLMVAVRLATAAHARQGKVLAIQRELGSPAYQVAVLPAANACEFELPSDRPMALIVLGAPGQGRSVDAELLRQLFGLSDAEARIVAGLAEGLTLKQMADQAQVGIATVRTQLQMAFGKTNTHRQTELVQLVSALPRLRR